MRNTGLSDKNDDAAVELVLGLANDPLVMTSCSAHLGFNLELTYILLLSRDLGYMKREE